MKKIAILLTALFFLNNLHAQFVVSGTVMDSASHEPLSAASVFCQNTTLGTVTNREGHYSLSLKSGGYDLIFTYTGYQTQTVRITGDVNKVDILLVKEDKNLGEVVIKSSNEVLDGWEKYGSFFLENFIGATPYSSQCKLENPEAVKFYFLKRSNKLRIIPTEPLQITNNALGYKLSYKLDSFVFNYNTKISSYRGFCLYTEMEGTDSMKARWSSNRAKAYEGSKLHFMRSYYDSTLVEDGWAIGLLDEADKKKFNKLENPYDTTYYSPLDSTTEISVYYPNTISVTYTKLRPEPEYMKKYKFPGNVIGLISYIDMANGIAIKENGYYYDQKDWVNQGYWSWKNLADQLPYDYVPSEK
jgi:hypothetical protein